MVYFNAKKFIACADTDTPCTSARLSELTGKLGTPQRRIRYVRLAGSNGKTVCAEMLMSVMNNSGYTVGCLRMPVREEPCENVCINAKSLSMDEFAEHMGSIKDVIPSLSFTPNASELLLCVALLAFEKHGCDLCIIESDHFGDDPSRFLPPPFAAVICGTIPSNDTDEIMRIRSYICKGISEIVSVPQNSEAYRIISNACYSVNCRLTLPSKNALRIDRLSLGGTDFTYEGTSYSLRLCGRFQVSNAVLLLETVGMLVRKGYKVDRAAVTNALSRASIPAKFEPVSLSPLIIIDSTHTPVAIETVCDALADFRSFTGRNVRLCLPQGQIIENYVKALEARGYSIESIVSEMCDTAPPYENVSLFKTKRQIAKAALDVLDKDTVLLISGEPSFVLPVRRSILEILSF